MYDALHGVIAESGIWNGARRSSHAFLLSPSVYRITEGQRDELSKLGHALSDCLLGLSRIAVVAYDETLQSRGAWLLVRRVFSTGVPKIYRPLQGMYPMDVPRLLKVDLMVNADGCFKIAEVDGHNKHGVGYSTLGLRFRDAIVPGAKALPGVAMLLSGEVKRLGYAEMKLFYADREQFYVPEFQVACEELGKHGVPCRLVSESEADTSFLESGLFLDLPFLYNRQDLYPAIVNAYQASRAHFIIPPKPFLGAKGVLALLRNDGRDGHLEAILKAFIREQSLELVRSYVPETILVGKRAERSDSIRQRVSRGRYVLKQSISSGMHGTVFSDDPVFDEMLGRACDSNADWILQAEVQNQPQRFSWFENGNGCDPELKTDTGWFMRVTVQYVNRELADVIVTARRGKAVHGARDCIQLGTVVL
jgi:hypothetical protein